MPMLSLSRSMMGAALLPRHGAHMMISFIIDIGWHARARDAIMPAPICGRYALAAFHGLRVVPGVDDARLLCGDIASRYCRTLFSGRIEK